MSVAGNQMDLPPPEENNAAPTIGRARAIPFSGQAEAALARELRQYENELAKEAHRIAGVNGVDSVSAIHVEQAGRSIGRRANCGIARHFGAFGGILAGASLSTVLGGQQLSFLQLLTAFVLAIAGAGLLGHHIRSGRA